MYTISDQTLQISIKYLFITATEIHYTDYETLTYTQCDGSGEDASCSVTGYSIEDHLHYLNLHEGCDDSSSFWSSILIDVDDLGLLGPSTTSIDSDVETTETTDIGDNIIYQWKEGLSYVSKIALSIAVAVGWFCAFICCLCCLNITINRCC